MPRRTIALICGIVFLTSACHTYRYADQGEAVSGLDVRIRLTPEESGRLMESVRVQNRLLEGTVVEGSTDNGIMLEVQIPGSNPTLYQRISVPQTEIVELEIQEFSMTKTALLMGAVAAAALAIGITAAASDKNEGEGGPPIEPDQIRIPLFSFGTR